MVDVQWGLPSARVDVGGRSPVVVHKVRNTVHGEPHLPALWEWLVIQQTEKTVDQRLVMKLRQEKLKWYDKRSHVSRARGAASAVIWKSRCGKLTPAFGGPPTVLLALGDVQNKLFQSSPFSSLKRQERIFNLHSFWHKNFLWNVFNVFIWGVGGILGFPQTTCSGLKQYTTISQFIRLLKVLY